MNYAFICIDDGDQDQTRSKHLIKHLRYVESVLGKMVVGGPCQPSSADDTRQFQGSIMVYEAGSEAEARALFNGDPYVKNGVWKDVTMLPFTPVAGQLIGGKTWEIDGETMKRTEPHGL